MPNATRTDVSLFYETYGSSGDPTVLVHGSWGDHSSWGGLVPSLSQALAVVAYDRRGHGASRGPRRESPVRDDAVDLAMLLESIDLYPAHLIAFSYGSAVALRLAIDRPELVRSVAVHEPPFLGLLEYGPAGVASSAAHARAGVRRLQELARNGDGTDGARDFVERLPRDSELPGPVDSVLHERIAPGSDRWVEEFDDPETMSPSRAELASLDLPILVTTGETSSPLFHAIQAEMAGLLRNGSLRTLPETGGVPRFTSPAVYAGALVTFLLERNVPST
jgi:pimeloyl-ACP methyl ester carboxylesterase